MTKFQLTYVFHFSTLGTSALTFLHTLFHHDPSNVYLKTENTAIQCKTWGFHSSAVGQVVPAVLKDNIPRLLDPEYTDTMIHRKVWNYPPNDNTASYPRKLDTSIHSVSMGRNWWNEPEVSVSYMHRTFGCYSIARLSYKQHTQNALWCSNVSSLVGARHSINWNS